MEMIGQWSAHDVQSWMRGLPPPLPSLSPRLSAAHVTGHELLLITADDLGRLGVASEGQRQGLLAAVGALAHLEYGGGAESLRALSSNLATACRSLVATTRAHHHNHNSSSSNNKSPNPLWLEKSSALLDSVVGLVDHVRSIVEHVERSPLANDAAFVSFKNSIITVCLQLITTTRRVGVSISETEEHVMSLCQELASRCESPLVASDRPEVVSPAWLHCVSIGTPHPQNGLGLVIKVVRGGQHLIASVDRNSVANQSGSVDVGNEIIAVNGQVVVAWQQSELVQLLRDPPSSSSWSRGEVTLTLRKRGLRHKASTEGLIAAPSPRGADPPATQLHHRPSAPLRRIEVTLKPQQSPPQPRQGTTQRPGLATSRRRVSCAQLGPGEACGWLWRRPLHGETAAAAAGFPLLLGPPSGRWRRVWASLQGPRLYWFHSDTDEKAKGFLNVTGFRVDASRTYRKKHAFRVFHAQKHTFHFAADTFEDMTRWMNLLGLAAIGYSDDHLDTEDFYSESDDGDDSSSNGSQDVTITRAPSLPVLSGPRAHPPRFHASTEMLPLPPAAGTPPRNVGTKAEAGKDGYVDLYQELSRAALSPIGVPRPTSRGDFRRSFAHRCRHPRLNERLHQLRVLQSTLKDREGEMAAIDTLLLGSGGGGGGNGGGGGGSSGDDGGGGFSVEKFRAWKQQNAPLLREILRREAAHGTVGTAAATTTTDSTITVSTAGTTTTDSTATITTAGTTAAGTTATIGTTVTTIGTTADETTASTTTTDSTTTSGTTTHDIITNVGYPTNEAPGAPAFQAEEEVEVVMVDTAVILRPSQNRHHHHHRHHNHQRHHGGRCYPALRTPPTARSPALPLSARTQRLVASPGDIIAEMQRRAGADLAGPWPTDAGVDEGLPGPGKVTESRGQGEAVGLPGPGKVGECRGQGEAVGLPGPVKVGECRGQGEAVGLPGPGKVTECRGQGEAVGLPGSGKVGECQGQGQAVGLPGPGKVGECRGQGQAEGLPGAGKVTESRGQGQAEGLPGPGKVTESRVLGEAVGSSPGPVESSLVGSVPVGSSPVGSSLLGSSPVGLVPVGLVPVGSPLVGSALVGSVPVALCMYGADTDSSSSSSSSGSSEDETHRDA